jgi:hypothetical protein
MSLLSGRSIAKQNQEIIHFTLPPLASVCSLNSPRTLWRAGCLMGCRGWENCSLVGSKRVTQEQRRCNCPLTHNYSLERLGLTGLGDTGRVSVATLWQQNENQLLGSRQGSSAALMTGCLWGWMAFTGALTWLISTRERRPKQPCTGSEVLQHLWTVSLISTFISLARPAMWSLLTLRRQYWVSLSGALRRAEVGTLARAPHPKSFGDRGMHHGVLIYLMGSYWNAGAIPTPERHHLCVLSTISIYIQKYILHM